jgi:hypothetical protein
MPLLSDVRNSTFEPRKENLKNKMNINNLHKISTLCGEISATLTKKAVGYGAVGNFDSYEACLIEKAQKMYNTGKEVVSLLMSNFMLIKVVG